MNLDKAKKCILEGLDEYVKTWADKTGIDRTVVKEWEHNVSQLIDKRIGDIYLKSKQSGLDNLSSPELALALEEIQKKYIIAPIDKATGNVAFICKKFYALVLLKELGLDNSQGNKTYEIIHDKSSEEI